MHALSGCAACWPNDPVLAYAARDGLTLAHRLVDESHFGVSVLRCGHCGQQLVSVFSERIDWAGGSDPQEVSWMPLTEPEAAALIARAAHTADGWEPVLRALAPERAAWLKWFPSDAAAVPTATRGLSIGPHD